MRAIVQRARSASVSVNGDEVGSIGPGLVVFLGVGVGDCADDARQLAAKVANLRIFDDEAGRMNLSCLELGLPALVISQFTLYGDCRGGRRPSFSTAAPPEVASELYMEFVERLREAGLTVQTGRFRASMVVTVANDGPVTIMLDSKKAF